MFIGADKEADSLDGETLHLIGPLISQISLATTERVRGMQSSKTLKSLSSDLECAARAEFNSALVAGTNTKDIVAFLEKNKPTADELWALHRITAQCLARDYPNVADAIVAEGMILDRIKLTDASNAIQSNLISMIEKTVNRFK